MRVRILGLAWVAALLTACGGTVAGGGSDGGEGGDEPLRIGLITGLTGAYVQLGQEQRNGAELAVQHLGGRAGERPIELLVRDGQLRPDAALREAQSLVQAEQVDFLVGCVSAATTLAINQVASQAGVPYIGACQTEQLNRPPNYNPAVTYHIAPTTSIPINASTPYLCNTLGKSIFLLLPDYALGYEQEAAYLGAVAEQPGCAIVGKAYFPLGTTDFNPYIPTIEGSGAEVLVFGGAGRDQVSFLRQAEQFALTDRFRTFITVSDLTFDEELGFPLVDGTYAVTAFWWAVDEPGAQEYVAAYREAYDRPPGTYVMYTWNAVRLIADQVAAGHSTPEQFRQAVEGLEISYAQGPTAIRACDHQTLGPAYVLEGLSAEEAATRGGDPRFGFRAVVQAVPGGEQTAPTCAEVATEFQRPS